MDLRWYRKYIVSSIFRPRIVVGLWDFIKQWKRMEQWKDKFAEIERNVRI